MAIEDPTIEITRPSTTRGIAHGDYIEDEALTQVIITGDLAQDRALLRALAEQLLPPGQVPDFESCRTAWWKTKIEANAARDRDTDRRLGKAGWRVLRIWSHEKVSVAVARVRRRLAGPAGKATAAGCP
jgi:hypothetical protein